MTFVLKISKKSAFLFMCFCMWILPTYLYSVSIITWTSSLFSYAAAGICAYDFVKNKRKCSIGFYLILIGIMVQGIATQLSNPDMLFAFIRQNIKQAAFYYTMDQLMGNDNAGRFLNVLSNYLAAMILVNLLTIILFPNGMYTSGSYSSNYWMGYDNTHIRWQLPAIAISCIYSLCTYGKLKIKTILLLAVIVLSNILVYSGTAMIALVVYVAGLVYIMVGQYKNEEKGLKIFSPITALGVAVIGSVMIIGSIIGTRSLRVVSYVAELLGKDSATLTGRSYIWINSLSAIWKQPLFGYGYESGDTTSMRLVGRLGYGLSPHNICLEILYYGGIILAVVTCLIYIAIFLRNRPYKNIPSASICGLWLFTISLMGLVEPQYDIYTKLAWLMCYNIPHLYRETGLIKEEKKIG